MQSERIVHEVADMVRGLVGRAEDGAAAVARTVDGLRGAGESTPEAETVPAPEPELPDEPVPVTEPEPEPVPEPQPEPVPEPQPEPGEITPPAPAEPVGHRPTTEELMEQLRSGPRR